MELIYQNQTQNNPAIKVEIVSVAPAPSQTIHPCPSDIKPHHWKEIVEGSANDPIFAGLNYLSLEGDAALHEAIAMGSEEKIKRTNSRGLASRKAKYGHIEKGIWLVAGNLEPLTGELMGWSQVKPDFPKDGVKKDENGEYVKTGKLAKYETPAGVDARCYFMQIPPHLIQKIADRCGVPVPEDTDPKKVWMWVHQNYEIPIMPNEGPKKTGASITAGYAAIGLPGVTMGYRTVKDEEGNIIDRVLHPDLAPFMVKGRKVLITFDQDSKPETRENTKKAIAQMAVLVAKEGAIPIVPLWNTELGKGVDDLIVNHGEDAFHKSIDKAIYIKLGDIDKYLEEWESKGMSREQQNKILRDAALSQINQALGIPTFPTLKAKFKRPPKEDIIGAEIAEEYRNKLIFNVENKKWMQYGSKFDGLWQPASLEIMNRNIRQILKVKGIQGFGSHSYVTNILKEMEAQLIVEEWNEKPSHQFLPYRNGVLNIQSGEFQPHAPGNRFTWQLPREYDPLATDWGKIHQFLMESTGGDESLLEIVLCLCNAILKGRADLHKFGLLIGPGGTGKGTLINLISALIGEQNVHSTNLSSWCGSNFEPFNAYGKRLIIFPDEGKARGNIDQFLKVTGGDFLRGEEKGKQSFNFKFGGMALMASNVYPFVGDASSPINRRVITIPFKNQVPLASHRDLQKEFEPELNAFTNYLISIPDDWVNRVLRGANENQTVRAETWDGKVSSDSLAAWVNDCCIHQPDTVTPVGSKEDADPRLCLYPSYVKFCEINNLKPKASNRFTRDLKDLCKSVLQWELKDIRYSLEGEQIRGVQGLKLRLPFDFDPTVDQSLKRQLDSNLDSNKPLPHQELDSKTVTSLIQSEINLETSNKTEEIASCNSDTEPAKSTELVTPDSTVLLSKPLPDKDSLLSSQLSSEPSTLLSTEKVPFAKRGVSRIAPSPQSVAANGYRPYQPGDIVRYIGSRMPYHQGKEYEILNVISHPFLSAEYDCQSSDGRGNLQIREIELVIAVEDRHL